LPSALRPRWWQHDLVRFPVAVLLVTGCLMIYGSLPRTPWEWPVSEGASLDVHPRGLLMFLVALAQLLLLLVLSRPEELPRAVRLPAGRGQWFLARDFREAEDYRARWCRNPGHQHPYDDWEQAQAVGCRQAARPVDR
jgi:hypothetical protein